MGSPHGCPWCGAPAPAAQAGRGRDGDGRRPAAAQHRWPRPRGRSRAEPSPCGLGAEGRPRCPCLASRLPSPRHGEPGAAAETRCTAQRCPQLLPTRRQRWGLGDLPPFPTHGAGPGGGGGDAETRRCVQHGGPGAMSHSAGGAGSSGTRVLTPPRLLSAVAVPQDPGDRGTEGTPTVGVGTWPFRPQRGRHPTTVPVLQVARGRENKNLRYSTISWETKERPLLPSLPS